MAINPATAEVCNGADDNCNKIVDEPGATGCKAFYFDGDQDGIGAGGSQCLCAADNTTGFTSPYTGDCADNCATCYPAFPGKAAAPEQCDGFDNNCAGGVDEQCNKDGDAYCDAAKITVGTSTTCPKGGGDCNDSNGSIYPTAFEQCNNIDDNCNATIDENASDQCLQASNAVVGCVAGTCVIKSCLTNFYNLNSVFSDGCECNGADQYEPNNTCGQAYTLTTSMSDTGINPKEQVQARLVDSSDEDWYSFYAPDTSDSGHGVCDKYNVRVVFTANPGGLAFEMNRGGCPNGSNTVCCGQTDFNWFTNFKAYSDGSWSKRESEWGECPCTTNTDSWSQMPGWNLRPNQGFSGAGGPYCKDYDSGYVCFPKGYYYTRCKDDSAWFYIRVYKASGGPVCANYRLEITNAVYGTPGNYGYKDDSGSKGGGWNPTVKDNNSMQVP